MVSNREEPQSDSLRDIDSPATWGFVSHEPAEPVDTVAPQRGRCSPLHPRIEHVSQSVTDEVETDDNEGDR